MSSELYRGYRIEVDPTETVDGWSVRWEVMQEVKSGWMGIKAENIVMTKKTTEADAVMLGFVGAKGYIDSIS